jgi:hypothetical protein
MRTILRTQEFGKVLPDPKEIGGALRIPRRVENEEAVLSLGAFEDDGTKSINEVARLF